MRRLAAKMPEIRCIRANRAGSDENAHTGAHLRTNILIDQESSVRSVISDERGRLEFVEIGVVVVGGDVDWRTKTEMFAGTEGSSADAFD
jgi:hypothetical protein